MIATGRTTFETLAASAPLSVVEGRNFRVVQRAFPSFAVAQARFAGQLPVIHGNWQAATFTSTATKAISTRKTSDGIWQIKNTIT